MILLMEEQPQHLLTHRKQTTLIGGHTRKLHLTANRITEAEEIAGLTELWNIKENYR